MRPDRVLALLCKPTAEEEGEEWRPFPTSLLLLSLFRQENSIETENHVFRKSTSRLRRVKITENIFPSMLEGGEREGGRGIVYLARSRAHTVCQANREKRSKGNI